MVSVCMYFQVHQPDRLKKYSVFDIGNSHEYFDEEMNEKICKKVAKKCYLPANKVILELIKKTNGNFKCAYSITGTVLEQFEKYCPEVIESFKELVKTGHVEFLSETYHHSLSFLYSKDEFKSQVKLHSKKIKELFGFSPTVFRNTELIYNNELAKYVEDMGYKGILAEGSDQILGWQSPNYLYNPKDCSKIKLMLKNYKLSDDIAFRFSNKSWDEWPLTADKFANWIDSIDKNGEVVNLFMDYETIGEHQWKDTGIFDFFKHFPIKVLNNSKNDFLLPSEVIEKYKTKADIDIQEFISWADVERDLSAWVGNEMQNNAIKELFKLEKSILSSKDEKLVQDWRKLSTSDHFYYMCTKYFADGDVHKYFNPYDSPYDSFIAFMNILNDLIFRLKEDNVSVEEIEINQIKNDSLEPNAKQKVEISENPSKLLKINA
jgi:alpha-amylase